MDEAADPLAERARRRVGSWLKDKWRLDDLIGVGGMAAVYSATHRNGIRVAVKMLHAELSGSGEVKTRFLREGYVANKVEHPGAVRVLDDETDDDGSVFLVMELLEGESLARRFERKARSLLVEEVLLVADRILDVLAAAHEKQIVHRDIKPDNIFLTRSGSVKLLDFGIARLRELPGDGSATRSGSTMGTPAYMAPEQARARWDEVDGRTDLWAVGATLFKLLTGRPVHVAETVNEQLLAAMTSPAPRLGPIAPTVPIPVIEIVDKALAFNKSDRWEDARSMQRAVRDAYEVLAGEPSSSVLLSFDDIARADGVPASGRAPTALTAANDAAVRSSRRRGGPRLLGWAVALASAGALVFAGLRAAGKLSNPRRGVQASPAGSPEAAPGAIAGPEAGALAVSEATVGSEAGPREDPVEAPPGAPGEAQEAKAAELPRAPPRRLAAPAAPTKPPPAPRAAPPNNTNKKRVHHGRRP